MVGVYGEKPPRALPHNRMGGVVSRGQLAQKQRLSMPRSGPGAPCLPPPPFNFKLKAPNLALSPPGLQRCCFKAQLLSAALLQSCPLGTSTPGGSALRGTQGEKAKRHQRLQQQRGGNSKIHIN